MFCKLIVLGCLFAVTNARSIDNFGFNISTLTSRIIGGHNAKQGEFPHQISLQVTSPGFLPFTHFCGGSILNKDWILTAAHCLIVLDTAKPAAIFVVKAGKHDLSITEDTEQTSLVHKHFIHENYNRYSPNNVSPYDIGLIKLKTPLQLNKRVVAIGLPKTSIEAQSSVILSGWGAVDNDLYDPKMPEILQTMNLEIIDLRTCMDAVRAVHDQLGLTVPSHIVIDDTNICTGPLTGGISACGGDSGGPLISRDSNGNPEVVGIVSWGLQPCGIKGAPTVYARTYYFTDWIKKIITKN